jgi:hypothetical protein
MVEGDGHSSVDAAVALWQYGFGFLGNLLYGFTPGSSSRALTGVMRPGVAFPVILCYDCHGSIPRMRGLGGRRGVHSLWAERLATLARLLDVSADYLLGLQDNAHVAPGITRTHGAAQETTCPVQSPRTRKVAPVA